MATTMLSASLAKRPFLYVYDHCPFCVRARMIFGLKKIPHQLVFLDNDDIETPTSLVGKKVRGQGRPMRGANARGP